MSEPLTIMSEFDCLEYKVAGDDGGSSSRRAQSRPTREAYLLVMSSLCSSNLRENNLRENITAYSFHGAFSTSVGSACIWESGSQADSDSKVREKL